MKHNLIEKYESIVCIKNTLRDISAQHDLPLPLSTSEKYKIAKIYGVSYNQIYDTLSLYCVIVNNETNATSHFILQMNDIDVDSQKNYLEHYDNYISLARIEEKIRPQLNDEFIGTEVYLDDDKTKTFKVLEVLAGSGVVNFQVKEEHSIHSVYPHTRFNKL